MNYIRPLLLSIALLCIHVTLYAQSVRFAFVTDTHIGGATGADDLRRSVQDINSNSTLEFVLVTGDITEFGSDTELALARQILDSLNKPWYVIGGNHDSNWSESGANSFRKVFGSETFAFVHGGYQFAATSSGPNMRMSPGQVPRENLVWLDSVLNSMKDPEMPLIYINHYPQDSSLNNWYDAIDKVKKRNVQLMLCGHGHQNRLYNFEGIPQVMGRSNLRAKDSIGGYNIVTIKNGVASFEERKPVIQSQDKWLEVPMVNYHFASSAQQYPRPSFAVNAKYPRVKKVWEFQDQSDIGSGMAIGKGLAIAANTNGDLYALDLKTGKKKWNFKTGGKIYSTPAISGNYVLVGSSDNNIYCVSLSEGKLMWKYATEKAVLGSPVIEQNVAYIGGSDGHFRAIQVKTGKLVWDFAEVKGFVVTRPLIYEGKIYFGCWGHDFYALDQKTGSLVWKWNNGHANRMFSPAACYPVAANGRVFIVAPDRYMTALDAESGKVIWRQQKKDFRVRESMGISKDGSLVYVKTMDGEVFGVSTIADTLHVGLTTSLKLPYELSPSEIVENHGLIYVPSNSGLATAIDRKSGRVEWQYKSSNALVNPMLPFGKKSVLMSTMDGKIVCLDYQNQERQ